MRLLDLLPFVALAAAMWLLLIRPARKRQQEQSRLVSSLQPGSRVMTSSGLFGTVTELSGEAVSLEISPGVVVKFVPQAIARVLPAPAPALAAPATTGQPEAQEAAAESDQPTTANSDAPVAGAQAPALEVTTTEPPTTVVLPDRQQGADVRYNPVLPKAAE